MWCEGVTVPAAIQSILPEGYTYHACHVDNFSQGDEVHFAATIRLDLRSKQDFGKWLDSFQEASSTTWRVKRTFPSVGMKIVFKKAYRCHHNTRPAKESTNAGRRVASKNTNCPADMVVSIKKSVYEGRTVSRSKDHHLPLYPAEIRLSYIHNHPIMCADALKFRDVSEEAKEELISLFKRKYGPTQAIDMIKYELQLKHGANYLLKAADRAVCPDVQFAHRLYRKVFKEEFGESTGEGMLHSLRTYISHYNTQVGSECMALDITSDNKVVMAICTPLMKRVHEEVKHASELVFIDASSNMDRYGCSVFLLLTHSCAGGLPLGVLITSSEAEGVIEAALKLYRSLLPQKCFGGRGVQGPALIMTDDSAAEQNAISHVFPASQTLLCVFHVLQATWRWLWNGKNQIPKEQRPNHLQHLKRLIYACTEEELEELYQESLQDTTLSDKFKEHLTGYYGRKEKWAIACRLDLQVRGNNTNNFCEAAMRVLKDKILERTKAFSIPQLADYMSTFLDEYYQQRLIDVANGRVQNVIASRYMPQEKSIKLHDIRQLSDSQFIVTSQTSQDRGYDVDMELGHCSCHAGKTGAPCKHQAAVVKHFNVSSTNFVPVNDPQSRLLLYKIATGNCSVPSGFFDGLMTQPSVSGDISIMDASFPAEPVIDEMESIPTSQIDPNPAVASLRAQAAAQNHFDLRGSTRSAQTSSSTNDDDQLLEQFQNMHDDLCTKMKQSPDLYRPAIRAMLASYRGIKTDTHLVSALHTFGKYSGAAMTVRKRGLAAKNAAVRHLNLKGSKKIGVQPTSTARRCHMGRGASRLHAGRPPKSLRIQEHGYSRLSSSQSSAVVPLMRRRRAPAPHSLSHVVSLNQALGKTHSAK